MHGFDSSLMHYRVVEFVGELDKGLDIDAVLRSLLYGVRSL